MDFKPVPGDYWIFKHDPEAKVVKIIEEDVWNGWYRTKTIGGAMVTMSAEWIYQYCKRMELTELEIMLYGF